MVAARSSAANSYEEARNKRLEENKRKFQDLGISTISKTLSAISTPETTKPQRVSKPKAKFTCLDVEPRRSSRPRNPIVTYQDEMDISLPTRRSRRLRSTSSALGSYLARPLEECRLASYEEKTAALKAAEKLRDNLQSENPSFVKSMVRSHVYSCFWLGLPSRFCNHHLSKTDSEIVLEDEDGNEYDTHYLAKRNGLSGGWRAFAMEHKLDDGDAVVFELTEPARFKIYIVKAAAMSSLKRCKNIVDKEDIATADNTSKAIKPESQPIKKPRPARGIEPMIDDSKVSRGLESNQKRRSKRATMPEIDELKTSPALGSIATRRSKRGTMPEMDDSKISPNLPTESLKGCEIEKEVTPTKGNSVAPKEGTKKKDKANRIRKTESPEGSEVKQDECAAKKPRKKVVKTRLFRKRA